VLYVGLTRARARLYLPRFPGRSIFGLNGAYSFLNDRLNGLLGGITPDDVRRLFRMDAIACPLAPEDDAGTVAPGRAVAAWQPPADLLSPPAPDPAFREAATARAGFIVTSFSAIRRARPEQDVDAAAGAESETAPPAVAAPPDPDELPRGRLSGTFLHDVIEHLPLDTLTRAPDFEAWRQLPEVGELFEEMRRRHDRHPAHLPHAQRLVHTALSVPVRLGEVTVPSLGGAGHPTREMEFLYPIPARHHPALDPSHRDRDGNRDSEGPAWRIERGVVKGFIDYLFEHDGRVYVCDWKSDTLPSWTPAEVAAHCTRDYAVQAEVYTLAAVRLLGLDDATAFDARFGGVLYCFLRGMRADDAGAGIYFRRPVWDEIQGWQRAMLEPRYWGMG
jgi:exodeoxyribonuclease V beta subunit